MVVLMLLEAVVVVLIAMERSVYREDGMSRKILDGQLHINLAQLIQQQQTVHQQFNTRVLMHQYYIYHKYGQEAVRIYLII